MTTKTTEPIARVEDGIIKLHEFEKHHIVECLRKELVKAEKMNEEFKTQGWTGTGLVGKYIIDLKAVLERVEATPTTKSS